MGDLISRKRLLEHIEQWLKANSGGETRTEYAVIDSCYRMVQNFPTAYDTEETQNRLREMYEGFCDEEGSAACRPDYCRKFSSCVGCFYGRTIEILKAGDVDG